MTVRNFNNTSPPQVLTDAVDNSGSTTALIVGSTSGYPTPPFTLGLERGTNNQEVALCTAIPNSTTFTVVRGYNGTSPVAHEAGATVEHTSAAIDFAEANAFINLLTTVGDLLTVGGSGAQRFGVGANGTSLTADSTQASGLSWVQTIAPGICAHTAASAAPPGWFIRNGAAVSRTTYSALYGKIGTTYGSGDGSTTFNLPGGIDRMDVGAGDAYGLGALAGSSLITIAESQMPSHGHANQVLIGGITVGSNDTSLLVIAPGSSFGFGLVPVGGLQASFTTQPSLVVNIDNAGGGGQVDIRNPLIALTPIIKY